MKNVYILNFSQIRPEGGGHQISFFPLIQNCPHFPRGVLWVLMLNLTYRGPYHCLMPDYAHRWLTSPLIMVPINFWQISDPFLAQKLTELEHFQ